MSFSLIVLDEFEGWERRTSSKGKASEKENCTHMPHIRISVCMKVTENACRS
jgi:hypothetical protein